MGGYVVKGGVSVQGFVLDSVVAREVECPVGTHEGEEGEGEEAARDAVDGAHVLQREGATQQVLAHVATQPPHLRPRHLTLAPTHLKATNQIKAQSSDSF